MRTVQWQGVCQEVRWQVSGSARSQPARRVDGLLAFGEQRCPDFEFAWQLSSAADWSAERLDIRLVGVGADRRRLNRTLLLERDPVGWRSRSWSNDTATVPPPGLAAPDGPTDGPSTAPAAVDVAIDACPLSHWAAVRRLGLAGPLQSARRGSPSRPLAVALPVLRVRLPSLSVVLTRQRYVWVEDTGRARVLNHSFAGGPVAPLIVDDLGLPIAFDGLSRRPDAALVA